MLFEKILYLTTNFVVKYKKWYAVFLFLFLLPEENSLAQNIDSLGLVKPKSCLKIQWTAYRFHSPFILPNGLKYEHTLGKKLSYEIGLTFFFDRTGKGGSEIAGTAELRYYLRNSKHNYSLKGFFIRNGLVYQHIDVEYPNYISQTAAITLGLGYQWIVKNKFIIEVTTASAAGYYSYNSPIQQLKFERLDAFRWGELGFKFGYAF